MLPLWNKYHNYQNSIVDSLAIFLEGYAFERQGTRPDYSHAAVDSLIACKNNLTPNCVWKNFKQKLNNRLNQRLNPIYPSSNPDNIQNINEEKSVIEVLNLQNQSTLSTYINNLMTQGNNIIQSFEFLKNIRGVGDKIASFYLRDLVVVLKLNLGNVQNRQLLQPIDIWVERVIKCLVVSQNMNKDEVANWIVTNSLKYDLNPEYINMGIWFYGSIIANSEYRLNRTLRDMDMARSLIKDFRSRIANVSKNC